jgi:hypothetical protein
MSLTVEQVNPECPICMESITSTNTTITDCGHAFHSSCIFKHIVKNNLCPLCRNEMYERERHEIQIVEDDDDDDETLPSLLEDSDSETESFISSDSDTQSSDSDDDDDVVRPKITITQITEVLKNKLYTECDIMNCMIHYVYGYRKNILKMSEGRQRRREMLKIIDGLIEGEIPVDHRDTRTYAQVVQSMERSDPEVGRGPSRIQTRIRPEFIGPIQRHEATEIINLNLNPNVIG